LCHVDIAEMNLLCATGLPGAGNLSAGRCRATLDAWARQVRRETDRHLYRFRQAPAEFNHSEGYFRMLMLVTVLQQDFGVRYNPDRIRGIDFRDSRDLFIHGLLEEPHTGTCASMPVLYVAAGKRLGYPLKLVLTHGHIFARWEGADGRDRFNVECASRGMLSFPDEYYKTWPTPLTDEQVRRGRYLLSLGAAEELAVFVESRGHCLLDNGRIQEARMAYEHACRLDPLSPGHWSWLEDARVREASLVPHGGNLNTFSNWGCSMTISCLPITNSTLSAEPARTFPLDSTRYRNYHPTLGRWIERDRAYYDGPNMYEYAKDGPSDLVDPFGLKCMIVQGDPGTSLAGVQYADETKKWFEKTFKAVDECVELLKKFDEKTFGEIRDKGKVLFDGEKFNGTLAQYTDQVKREKESIYVRQVRGGPDALAWKTTEFVCLNREKYDFTVVGLHGVSGEGTVRINDVETNQASYVTHLKVIGAPARGLFEVVTCFADGKGRTRIQVTHCTYRVEVEGIKVCAIEFVPAKAGGLSE
jgi:hypothetical protein